MKHQNCQQQCFISSCHRSDRHPPPSCLACIILNDSRRCPASSENDGVPEAQTGADWGSRRSQITMTSQTQRSQTCNSTEAAVVRAFTPTKDEPPRWSEDELSDDSFTDRTFAARAHIMGSN